MPVPAFLPASQAASAAGTERAGLTALTSRTTAALRIIATRPRLTCGTIAQSGSNDGSSIAVYPTARPAATPTAVVRGQRNARNTPGASIPIDV